VETPPFVDHSPSETIAFPHLYLVGGLEDFLFFHSVGIFIIPTDELIFFRGVGIPPARLVYLGFLECVRLMPRPGWGRLSE